jgi:Stigma-specific protein, Stig1
VRRAARLALGAAAAAFAGAILGLAGCGRIFLDGVVGPSDGGTCRKGEVLCDDTCAALDSDPAHCGHCEIACGASEVCTHGACAGACSPGESACGAACVDLASDPAHCGACGHVCSGGSTCKEGECVCPENDDKQSYCDGDCVDTKKSHDHCGGCGKGCESGQECQDGHCQ